ncbi:MAG: UvrD-helicase domain-containing protein [Bacteroidales bacterium]|nr:UvrD-helicase domain-containing protein [Bacteroidales bacterium]
MERVHYINAGAGAGKTTTLVKELRRILTEKDANENYICQPSEIILTTYTKAAAKEFREKTFKKLLETPAALDVAKILDTATIGTVHSVAQQYLQRYWSLLGYSGQFNVMTDQDKKNYIDRSLRESVNERDIQFFKEYAAYFEIKNNKNKTNENFWKEYVKEIISKMHAYNIAAADLTKYSKKSCTVVKRLFNAQFDGTLFAVKASVYYNYLDDRRQDMKAKRPSEAKKAINKMNLYDNIVAIPKPGKADIEDFLSSEFFKGKIDDKNPNCKNIEQSRKSVKEYLESLLFFNPTKGKKVQECIKRIFKIASQWSTKFDNYKRENNLLDFDDLEAKFLELLDIDAVKEDIKSSVKYLFVDEFQDSNPIQLEIFQKLSELVQIRSYWVGDPKQAIYGFRGSDSSLTTQLLKKIPKPELKKDDNYVFKQNGDQCTAELIKTSWRSIKSLVQLSNEVFKRSFKEGVPSERIKQVPLGYLRKGGKIKKPIQHWHCGKDKYDALATRVAEILNGKCGTIPGVYKEEYPEKKKLVKIVPSDIAILTSMNDTCADIAEALRKKNIPVALAETEIRDKAEVKLVLALLKYVANKNRKYAKIELAKLLENKKIGTILKEIVKDRYDFYPNRDEKDMESHSATTTVSKDPDKFFAMLDDKLNGLRGLNISAIVKGIIAVLDLRNVVAKWKMADIRRENLDMLIKKASDFERTTAHTPNSATVSDFIAYMQNPDIDAQLDQSADGVKVATYHKSKGLQWKIVILDSLTQDDLDNKKFVKNNWFGLNLKGGYNAAQLQLIPSIGNINDSMSEIVEDLKNKKGDNGNYNLQHGKVEGELKRLLYVGVTRARDYLVTISTDDKPLKWVQNVRQDTLPSKTAVLEDIANQTSCSFIDLWGVPKHLAWYEQISNDPTVTYKKPSAKATRLKEVPMNQVTEHKRISPSKLKEKCENMTPKIVEDFKFTGIKHGSIEEKDYAAFGTCIHNYFAAHRWDGKDKISGNVAYNEALAARTIANHNMSDELPHPKLLTQAADTLFDYLERTYGKEKELLRETPFTYRRKNGQLVSGEMDLIWKLNDKDCILLDYKNFPAQGEKGKDLVMNDDEKNDHYVGHYFPQLREYRTALEAAGMTVTHVFVFYAVLGCLVEVMDNAQ